MTSQHLSYKCHDRSGLESKLCEGYFKLIIDFAWSRKYRYGEEISLVCSLLYVCNTVTNLPSQMLMRNRCWVSLWTLCYAVIVQNESSPDAENDFVIHDNKRRCQQDDWRLIKMKHNLIQDGWGWNAAVCYDQVAWHATSWMHLWPFFACSIAIESQMQARYVEDKLQLQATQSGCLRCLHHSSKQLSTHNRYRTT